MSQSFERFGKYILLEKLASGGMAEVYLCKSTGAEGVNKFVAIKRILPQYSENPEFVEMFKEEAKIAVNLSHSNIVSIYDFGIERSQFFIVMDYLEGKNLRQITTELKKQNQALTIEQIVYIIKEASAGLDHAHRSVDHSTGRPLNIIHRDISPQNLMISYDGEVKVIDFGIAKAENQIEATKAGTLKGKYGYMSPEQADGQGIESSTDIFSLGIILWELLANDRLFTASNEAAILRKIRECQIPLIRKLNPSVPNELEKIVHKALAKDKSLRYQTTAAFHRDLNRFLNTAFPEFSPHDFAVFMKETFTGDFLDIQRKRVEYSKIKPAELNIPDKTIVSNTLTNLPTPPRPSTDRVVDENNQFDGNILDIDTAANIKVNLGTIKSQSTKIGLSTQLTRAGGTQAGRGTGHFEKSFVRKNNSKSNDSLSWLIPLSLVILLGTAAFLAWTKGLIDTNKLVKIAENYLPANSINFGRLPKSTTTRVQNPVNTITASEPTEVIEETTNLASNAVSSTENVSLTLYVENPTPDHIYIDDQDYGISPVRATVPRGKPVKIRFEKIGYAPYETKLTFTEKANSRHLKIPAENELLEVRIRSAVKISGTNLILINGEVPKKNGEYYTVKYGLNKVELSDGFAIYGYQEIFVKKNENKIFEIKVQGGNLDGIDRIKKAYSK